MNPQVRVRWIVHGIGTASLLFGMAAYSADAPEDTNNVELAFPKH